MEYKSYDFSNLNQQQLNNEVSQAIAKAMASGVESLSDRERAILLQANDSVDNAALTLGSSQDKVLHQGSKDPEGFLSGLAKIRQALSRRSKAQ